MIKTLINKYSTFMKYTVSAGLSFALDIGLFTIFLLLFKNFMGDIATILATVCARVISSLFNYLMNRNAVFKSGKNKADADTLVKYYILVVIQMFISAIVVFGIFKIISAAGTFMGIPYETVIKIPVDIIIFIINYFIQKRFIFIKGQEEV